MTEPAIDYGTPLAAEADVKAALRRDLTSEESIGLPFILAKASELFRMEARQQFTTGRSRVRLKVNAGRVYLHESPAGILHSVVDDRGRDVGYDRHGQWLDVCLPSDFFVTVDYDHGTDLDGVPLLVRLTVAEVAMKVLSASPKAREGIVQHQESTGPFSESDTYATWAQGGQTMLAPDDKATAQRFRPVVPRVWVQQS